MSFLTPMFFLGALALAIPIIVHLTNREKKDVVEFPSLMFLRRIPYRSVRRQKLRHLLLFALRSLALLLIVVAFARPFFEQPVTARGSVLGPREVVYLLDHSYSMGYAARFEDAKTAIRSRIEAQGPDERASVVAFSDRAEIVQGPSSDRAQISAALDGVRLSARTTRYGPALKLAKKIVEDSSLPRREVVLVSDFQRLGFDGDDDAWLPAGTGLTTVNVGGEGAENGTVTGVILERSVSGGRERLTASARVTYKAAEASEPISTGIRIELDGRTLQSKKLTLEPNSSTTVSFEPFTLPSGISRGAVRLDPDALERDNAYYFVLWPGQSLKVLSVERKRRRSFYLERALSIGDRPSFALRPKRSGALRASDLEGRDVVILNDLPSVSAAEANVLERFVSRGGGLIVVLGAASGPNAFVSEAARLLLPAPPGRPVDRARDWGGTLSYLDNQSPVFDIFAAPHSGDFSSAKFFRYRTFARPVSDGVLARFDDGQIALVEKRIGEGRVLVWTSTLDAFWNDLARQPVFLPFVHQLVKYAAGYTEAEAWQTVGDIADLGRYLAIVGEAEEDRRRDLVISSPSGQRTIVSSDEERPLFALTEQGFYGVRWAGGGTGGADLSLAANLDLKESDLAPLDPEELVAAVTFRDQEVAGAGETADTPADQERRQGFWWYLLVAAFALLAVETILSNRLSRTATLMGRPPEAGKAA